MFNMRIDLLNIILFILVLFLNSLLIFGVFKIMDYEIDNENKIIEDSKMVLWKIKYWLINHIGIKASKPFCLCPPCMSSIYGTLIYWCVYSFTLQHLFIWPIYCLCLCGINTFMQRWIID